ncbi:MAG: hypothetical protein JWM47_2158 [Acidimicrobiales bacterium]|nr:hypothetical protein [Acidimicrobiales bacterium]
MERVALTGLIVLRWAALAWMAVVLALSYDDLLRPWLALALVGAAFIYTALVTIWVGADPGLLLRRHVLAIELAIGVALVLGDGWAFDGGHAFSSSQSIGSIWPLAAVLSIGIGVSARAGMAAGALVGMARVGATFANGVREFEGGHVLSLVNSIVFYAVAGTVAGYVMHLLRQAERQISAASARDDLARHLHDGVLQTLAIVQRRSTDTDLVRLAREQDRDLREFLFSDGHLRGHLGELGDALRAAATRFQDTFGIRAEVLVPFDLPTVEAEQGEALARALGEALNNVGKHAAARHVIVFVEAQDDGHLFCSVKDDGGGFDEAASPPGVGISQSITARMADVGGRAEVRSRTGQGTEVCLWL